MVCGVGGRRGRPAFFCDWFGKTGQAPIHDGGTISLSYNGSVAEAFYQSEPYWATDDVNVLYPRGFSLTAASGLFLCTVIRREKFRFNYGRKWHLERMREAVIRLPATKALDADFFCGCRPLCKSFLTHIDV
ncbi:restriction endonuclease subunit S [Acetobacter lovaniensis]|uniref:Type I restriction modification DNA specificity domain-containing protein n=1 Tax=Acetobacter lovaniensis TaxID=104100 RepID=A0A841QJJ1_9PROT|nr:hypothetical protein [Acetobacter lovaniensis]